MEDYSCENHRTIVGGSSSKPRLMTLESIPILQESSIVVVYTLLTIRLSFPIDFIIVLLAYHQEISGRSTHRISQRPIESREAQVHVLEDATKRMRPKGRSRKQLSNIHSGKLT